MMTPLKVQISLRLTGQKDLMDLPAKSVWNLRSFGALRLLHRMRCSFSPAGAAHTVSSGPATALKRCAAALFSPAGGAIRHAATPHPDENCAPARKPPSTTTGRYLWRAVATIVLMLGAAQAHAACQVGANSYKESGGTGTPITLPVIKQWTSGDDITTCDVSSLTSLSSAFEGNTAFNQDISAWDTSNVTNMRHMFKGATAFNQPIKSWDTSRVTNMHRMFQEASSFNQDLNHQGGGNWDVGNVIDMRSMFKWATAFNGNISDWNVSNVIDMGGLFYEISFNQDIGEWQPSAATNIDFVFKNNMAFNQDIGNWDVSGATNMSTLFSGATAFNQDIGGWDVGNVQNMSNMFNGASAFNQDISGWDTSSVTVSLNMFNGATAMIAAYGTDGAIVFSALFNAPTLSSVSIASSNSTNTLAKADDVITLTFTASEPISTPVVTFNSGGAAITDTSITYTNTSGNTWCLTSAPLGQIWRFD